MRPSPAKVPPVRKIVYNRIEHNQEVELKRLVSTIVNAVVRRPVVTVRACVNIKRANDRLRLMLGPKLRQPRQD